MKYGTHALNMYLEVFIPFWFKRQVRFKTAKEFRESKSVAVVALAEWLLVTRTYESHRQTNRYKHSGL